MIEVDIYSDNMTLKTLGGISTTLKTRSTKNTPEERLVGTILELGENKLDGIIRVHCDLNRVVFPVVDNAVEPIRTHNLIVDFLGHTINAMSLKLDKRHSHLTLQNGKILNTYYTNCMFDICDGSVYLKNMDITCGNYRVGNIGTRYTPGRARFHVNKDCVIRSNYTASYQGGGVTFFLCGTEFTRIPDYNSKLKDQYVYQNNFANKNYRTDFYFDGTMICDFPSGAGAGGDDDVSYCICTNGSSGWVGPDITIGENANITVTGRTTGIGIHQVSNGTLTLLGGKITAPTGITCRSAKLYVPDFSNVVVHGTGEYKSYIIDTEGSLGGTNLTTGNAIMIESFPNGGYGSINGARLSNVPDVKVFGGTFKSDNNLAIGSFSHVMDNGTDYYPRATRFVSETVTLESNREHEPESLEGYDNPTGHGGDWDIIKPSE